MIVLRRTERAIYKLFVSDLEATRCKIPTVLVSFPRYRYTEQSTMSVDFGDISVETRVSSGTKRIAEPNLVERFQIWRSTCRTERTRPRDARARLLEEPVRLVGRLARWEVRIIGGDPRTYIHERSLLSAASGSMEPPVSSSIRADVG